MSDEEVTTAFCESHAVYRNADEWIRELMRRFHLAGLRAGREQAAKIVENATPIKLGIYVEGGRQITVAGQMADAIAAAIRGGRVRG